MSDIQNSKPQYNDEIDLAQLFKMIGNAFKNLFTGFLRVFLFLKKNLIILGVLFILGFALAYGLNQVITERYKTEVIVEPNYNSKVYLYDKIEEIQNHIVSGNITFFEPLGIDLHNLDGFSIEIEPIKSNKTNEEKDYLEFLKNFKDESFVTEAVKTEVFKKNITSHKITFFFKDKDLGSKAIEKIFDYLNTNTYYKAIKDTSIENLKSRIIVNEENIKQINTLIDNYSNFLVSSNKAKGDKMLIYDNQNDIDISSILTSRNQMIDLNEKMKIDLVEDKDIINILNMSSPQNDYTNVFAWVTKYMPFLFVSVFLFIKLILFLNKKASELS